MSFIRLCSSSGKRIEMPTDTMKSHNHGNSGDLRGSADFASRWIGIVGGRARELRKVSLTAKALCRRAEDQLRYYLNQIIIHFQHFAERLIVIRQEQELSRQYKRLKAEIHFKQYSQIVNPAKKLRASKRSVATNDGCPVWVIDATILCRQISLMHSE